MIKASSGLASLAISYAIRANKLSHSALQVLELGCVIIAESLFDLCGDLSDLENQYPELAAKFVLFKNTLDTPAEDINLPFITSIVLWESKARECCEAAKKFNEVIKEICALPEFSNFLLPLSEERLHSSARSGPVIVLNITSSYYDAFLVEQHQIRILDLSNLIKGDIKKHIQDLQASRATNTWNIIIMLR